MSRLMLLRHAKSAWNKSGLADIDRPLAPRGRRAAAAVAQFMAKDGLLPDRILCSPALRTRETMAALIPLLPREAEIVLAPGLYEPAGGDYRSAIAAHGNKAEDLMVIGHNPAIQATALILTGSGDTSLSSDLAAKYPTGALVVLEFDDADWSRLGPRDGRMVAFVKPRTLSRTESD